jgi:hypothetical protein
LGGLPSCSLNFRGASRSFLLQSMADGMLKAFTTRNYLICDAFSATFSENVTNVHCSQKHCDDFFNSSQFYDVFLFSSQMCIEAQNTTTIC